VHVRSLGRERQLELRQWLERRGYRGCLFMEMLASCRARFLSVEDTAHVNLLYHIHCLQNILEGGEWDRVNNGTNRVRTNLVWGEDEA
jgi:hypothetical protein